MHLLASVVGENLETCNGEKCILLAIMIGEIYLKREKFEKFGPKLV